MSILTLEERSKLIEFLDYIICNSDISEFEAIFQDVGVKIWSPEYNFPYGTFDYKKKEFKKEVLMGFLNKEPDELVASVLQRFYDHYNRNQYQTPCRNSSKACAEFLSIIVRLSPANANLSKKVKQYYNEARRVLSISKRGASALLRTALEQLTIEEGCMQGNLYKKLLKLFKTYPGIDEDTKAILKDIKDAGNAIHPSNPEESKEEILRLFHAFDLVADELYKHIEQKKLEEQEKRKEEEEKRKKKEEKNCYVAKAGENKQRRQKRNPATVRSRGEM